MKTRIIEIPIEMENNHPFKNQEFVVVAKLISLDEKLKDRSIIQESDFGKKPFKFALSSIKKEFGQMDGKFCVSFTILSKKKKMQNQKSLFLLKLILPLTIKKKKKKKN